MELKLNAGISVRKAKEQFSQYFPYLKLEFFQHAHATGKPSGPKEKVNDRTLLSKVTGAMKEGVFSFEPTITVGEFEQRIQHEFGIPVQVFRKSGDLWLETVQTDSYSLEKQNGMGKASVKRVNYNIHTLFL